MSLRRPGSAGLLAAVCLIIGTTGPIDVAPRTVAIAVGLSLWASSLTGAAWLPVLAGAPLLLHAQGAETRLSILIGIGLLAGRCARGGALFAGGALAWRLLLAGIPWLWSVEVETSRVLSGAVGRLTGQRIDFGPSASGMETLILFLMFVTAAGHGPARRAARRRMALAFAAWTLLVALLPALGGVRKGAGSPETAATMFGWSAALLLALCLLLPPDEHRAPRAARRRGTHVVLATALSIVLFGSLMIGPHSPGTRLAGPRRPGDVVLLKTPAIDMNVPEPDRLGAAQAGMFGLLPRYLQLDGHRMRLADGPVSADSLAGARVVIVALPGSSYRPEEISALQEYVRRGGSLLVLGDHTDLLGTMRPLNEITGGWGIRFAFDAAFPARPEWSDCLDGPGALRGRSTGIGTGASLSLASRPGSGAAGAGIRPLVVGRYGLADRGDRSNTGRGAYLGDYAYEPSEQLGDLVLAASTRVGRGRVVVFGDTSPFQNLVLPYSYDFVARLFDDLARSPGPADPGWAASGVAAAALGVMALAGSVVAAGGIAVAALGAIVCSTGVAGPAPLDRLPPDARVALVDAGHLNGYERHLWHERSIGGLLVNLERDGYLPLLVDDGFATRPIGSAALPVLLAPRAVLSRAETAALAAHVRSGGDLLVAAGAPESGAVSPLLDLFGLSIGATPLGPVPILPDMDKASFQAQRRLPQFRTAWPLEWDERPGSALASRYGAFGFDIVVEASRGGDAGRLLLIADPEFLTDRVLEKENDAWEGNVDLLRRLLARPAHS